MILGHDTAHAEAAVDAELGFGIDNVELGGATFLVIMVATASFPIESLGVGTGIEDRKLFLDKRIN